MSMMQTYINITARTKMDDRGMTESVIKDAKFYTMAEVGNDMYKDRLPTIPAGTEIIADFAGDFGMYGMAEIDGQIHRVKIELHDLHNIFFGEFDEREDVAKKFYAKRINDLADVIEHAGENFRMDQFANDCGTPACIAGHAAAIYRPADFKKMFALYMDGDYDGVIDWTGVAREVLGIKHFINLEDVMIDRELFAVNWVNKFDRASPSEVAEVLRGIVENGKIEWPEAVRYV